MGGLRGQKVSREHAVTISSGKVEGHSHSAVVWKKQDIWQYEVKMCYCFKSNLSMLYFMSACNKVILDKERRARFMDSFSL